MNSAKFRSKFKSLSRKLAGSILASLLFLTPVLAVDYERFVSRDTPCDPWEFYWLERWLAWRDFAGATQTYAYGLFYESQFAGTSTSGSMYIPGNVIYRIPKGETFSIVYSVPAGETFYFNLYDAGQFFKTVTTSAAPAMDNYRQSKVVIKKNGTQIYSAGSTSSTDDYIHSYTNKNTSSSSASYQITLTSNSSYDGYICPVMVGYDSLLKLNVNPYSSSGSVSGTITGIDYTVQLDSISLTLEEATDIINTQTDILTSINNKLTSIQGTLEDLYDYLITSTSSGSTDTSIVEDMNDSVSDLNDSIDSIDSIESSVLDDFSTSFDSIDLDMDTVGLTDQALTGSLWLAQQIQSIYEGSGDLHVAFTLPLILGLVSFFIGRSVVILGNNSHKGGKK